MAVIINASINLDAIDKSKVIAGKKGRYLPITITVNDDADTYGNQGPIIIAQSKEEREAKAPKTYLGNVKVAWTDGNIKKADFQQLNNAGAAKQSKKAQSFDDDLPF
jgi:hypothetical protein